MDPNMYTAAMRDRVDDLDQYSADQFALQVTPNGNTLLHVAAEFGSFFCVPTILHKCPSLLCRANNNGDTPIHVALTRENFHVIDSLMNFAKSAEGGGAAAVREMLRARNSDEDTPLHLAARYWKRQSMVRWKSMLDWGLTSQDQGLDHGPNKAGETPLYLYVDRGYDVDVLCLMLKTCTPLEYGGPSGRTALHAAVIRGRDEFFDRLIEWRNDLIKEPDANGLTPLHYAANNKDVKAIQNLLDKDKSVAYVIANNDEGNTALHMATAKGHIEVMEELLSKCPDCWEMVNRKGRNILHISADLERDEATKYISEQPWVCSLVNQKDHQGNTPMHVLAHKGNQNLYFRLSRAVDHDRKALNNEGLTPQDILLRKTDVSVTFQTDDDEAEIKKLIGRKYWPLEKKFLRDAKDQGGKGKMNSREPKEQHEKGKRNAGEDQKGKMADQRDSETLTIAAATLICEKEKEKAAEDMGKMADTHMIVATLITTITFAAGFTIPGGYHGEQGPNQGMAVLVREAAFKAFVISNTIALICSTYSVFLYVSASLFDITGREGEERAHRYVKCFWLILTAMVAMMLAFCTGAYAVLAHSLGLAIATCVIACSSIVVYFIELKGHFERRK